MIPRFQFYISKLYESVESTRLVQYLLNIPIFADDAVLKAHCDEMKKCSARMTENLSDFSDSSERSDEIFNKIYSHVNRKEKIIKAPIKELRILMQMQIMVASGTELLAVAYRTKRIIENRRHKQQNILDIEAETLADLAISHYGNKDKFGDLFKCKEVPENGYKTSN